MVKKGVRVEVVCCSIEDCAEAESGGADRIELCSAISLGGLTPSLGSVVKARERTKLPIIAMLRPRSGGFLYTEGEYETMRQDLAVFFQAGADGMAFGILDGDRRIDTHRCQRLVESAGPMQTVFHRAFDLVTDPFYGLETLIDLGFSRVMTSGGRGTALENADALRRLIDRAAGRIQILPGGGVRADNVAELVKRTGCDQVHLGPFREVSDGTIPSDGSVTYKRNRAAGEHQHLQVDAAAVRQVVETVKGR